MATRVAAHTDRHRPSHTRRCWLSLTAASYPHRPIQKTNEQMNEAGQRATNSISEGVAMPQPGKCQRSLARFGTPIVSWFSVQVGSMRWGCVGLELCGHLKNVKLYFFLSRQRCSYAAPRLCDGALLPARQAFVERCLSYQRKSCGSVRLDAFIGSKLGLLLLSAL